MRQLDFNDICRNRHKGNEMSDRANRRTNKSKDRKRILDYLATVADATSEEAAKALGMNRTTSSARFSELKAESLLTATQRRKTKTGSSAQAWKANQC